MSFQWRFRGLDRDWRCKKIQWRARIFQRAIRKLRWRWKILYGHFATIWWSYRANDEILAWKSLEYRRQRFFQSHDAVEKNYIEICVILDSIFGIWHHFLSSSDQYSGCVWLGSKIWENLASWPAVDHGRLNLAVLEKFGWICQICQRKWIIV